MILHMSVHTPHAHARALLLESMARYGAALNREPGLAYVDSFETKDGQVIGVALWESREAWERGKDAGRAAVAGDPFGEWESAAPICYTATSSRADARLFETLKATSQ